ncbi:MAG: holo-ACP synthase [Streptococcaceae bacterium]|jgi:holo-[acyl-carrier protein] synthase|nr:holo-ACP synthase [Streptococcaceae bacterium]
MIQGIGVDIVDLARMQKIIEKGERFIARILTPKEKAYFDNLNARRKIEYVAGRFAVKEAFAKALGTGLRNLDLQDIETLTNDSGAPYVTKAPFVGKVWVSISHTKKTAIAQIILEII